MKKLMLFVLMGLLTVQEGVHATSVQPALWMPAGVWIKLEVIFHRPKFNCETGFSICAIFTAGIDASGQGSERQTCQVRGQLNERGQLVLEIDEVLLSKYEGGTAFRYFKDKTSVSIPDPYILPEPTCRALGSATPLVIKPGNHPVSFSNGVYSVTFQL